MNLDYILTNQIDENTHCIFVKGKVSSDIEDLTALNEFFRWLPDYVSIRPSPEVLEIKTITLSIIASKWITLADYILHTVFEKKSVVENGIYRVVDKGGIENAKLFKPNEFPYNTEEGLHWVMWYGTMQRTRTDEEISNDIDEAIRAQIDPTHNYDFGWYVNPKMSVNDYFHVQVFWIHRPKELSQLD